MSIVILRDIIYHTDIKITPHRIILKVAFLYVSGNIITDEKPIKNKILELKGRNESTMLSFGAQTGLNCVFISLNPLSRLMAAGLNQEKKGLNPLAHNDQRDLTIVGHGMNMKRKLGIFQPILNGHKIIL
jgi:hypothetical protein